MTTQKLWTLYADDLKRFILTKVKDEAIADDLLQDTFIKVHTKLDHLKDESKVRPWLFTIARYTTIDYFRTLDLTKQLNDEDLTFEDVALHHTEEDCLRGIIKSLPKKYRDPLFLSDIKGLKLAEISQQLHLPLSTIKSQIQRGRKLIVKGFMDCCDFKMNDEGYLVGEIRDKQDCKVCN